MFDTKVINNQRYNQVINIKPSCMGLIQKSSPISRIVNCNIDSPLADELLNVQNPYLSVEDPESKSYNKLYIRKPVTVLQVMVFGDNKCIIEYVFTEDLNKED